jgi:D-alanyl-lipoteichoic acid acyltransferase DltB (MBOAT superfamily)
VTYLPHLFMGPIESYDRLAPNLFENRRMSWAGISAGAVRFAWGLFKKLVIAARVGVIISAISGDPETYRGGYALIAVLLYSVQLYSDFSGGMDMVLGISEMLGIRLSENFDAPYLSESFREFWRRWHMTLGGWLRNYVYIPLGGNRKGAVRKNINLVVTFLVSGLWHGGSYLLWGFFNGVFVCLGDRFKTRWKLLNRLGTCFLVSLLWCFYVWPGTGLALQMLGSVFTVFNYGEVFATIGTMGLNASDWIVLAVALVWMGIFDGKREALLRKYRSLSPAAQTALICALALVVLVFGMYGIGFNASEFIYSRF